MSENKIDVFVMGTQKTDIGASIVTIYSIDIR